MFSVTNDTNAIAINCYRDSFLRSLKKTITIGNVFQIGFLLVGIDFGIFWSMCYECSHYSIEIRRIAIPVSIREESGVVGNGLEVSLTHIHH